MLSGIVIVSPSNVPDRVLQDAVGRSLSTLVAASVSGLLGDVCIVAPLRSAALESVANMAGCRLLAGETPAAGLSEAVTAARYDTILLLQAGAAPASGFHHELDSLMRAGVRSIGMRMEPRGVLQRLVPVLCPQALVVAPRPHVHAAVSGGAAAAIGGIKGLARRLRPLRQLSTRAIAVAGAGGSADWN